MSLEQPKLPQSTPKLPAAEVQELRQFERSNSEEGDFGPFCRIFAPNADKGQTPTFGYYFTVIKAQRDQVEINCSMGSEHSLTIHIETYRQLVKLVNELIKNLPNSDKNYVSGVLKDLSNKPLLQIILNKNGSMDVNAVPKEEPISFSVDLEKREQFVASLNRRKDKGAVV